MKDEEEFEFDATEVGTLDSLKDYEQFGTSIQDFEQYGCTQSDDAAIMSLNQIMESQGAVVSQRK